MTIKLAAAIFVGMSEPFKDFFESLTPEEQKSLAEKAGTSVEYLNQLCKYGRRAGATLIGRLMSADERITFEMMRPDVFDRAGAR